MTAETWLFLFAAIGALGGMATMVDVSLKLSERLIGKTASTKQVAGKTSRAAKAGAIQISRPRFAVIAVLLLTSGALSIGGFVSSFHREEPLKPSLRSENVEGTIRQWLDHFHVGTQKIDSPDNNFS